MYDLLSRKTFARPQAMIWSDRKFTLVAGAYVAPADLDESLGQAIVLSDHGRSALQLGKNRIESRNRMINGTSRAFWTADKLTLKTSWTGLPSKVASGGTEYVNGKQSPIGTMFMADNGASALTMMDWYDSHQNSFYVYLSYDDGDIAAGNKRYVEENRMFFTSFDASMDKRGVYDFWNIDITLEEM